MALSNDEIQSMSDLASETEEALEIAKKLHDFLVTEVRHMRETRTDQDEYDTPLQRYG